MQVYWLEQTASEVPEHTDWLNATDAAYMNGLRFAKRRTDWLLGRWTAKQAVAACLHLPTDHETLADIEIRPEPSGAPEAFLSGSPAGVSISLSHSSGVAACTVAESGAVLGCDLEKIEPRSDDFIRDYFTVEELAQVAQAEAGARDWLVTLFWSAKESALKALRTGLRLDTRSLTVIPIPSIRDQKEELSQSTGFVAATARRAWQLASIASELFYRPGFSRLVAARGKPCANCGRRSTFASARSAQLFEGAGRKPIKRSDLE